MTSRLSSRDRGQCSHGFDAKPRIALPVGHNACENRRGGRILDGCGCANRLHDNGRVPCATLDDLAQGRGSRRNLHDAEPRAAKAGV